MKDRQFGSQYSVDLFECCNKDCSHVFVYPLPSQAEISSFYSTYSTHDQWSQPSSWLARYTSLVERLCGFDRLKEQRLAYVNAGLLGATPMRLLDFGCGAGNLLIELKENGWQDLFGIDFDVAAAEAAKRGGLVSVYVGGIGDLPDSAGKFDYIVMANVIEHLSDPAADLKLVKQRLTPNGRIIIRTPNANSFLRQIYGRNWRGWESPRHLNIFTPRSMERLAALAGLEIMSIETSNALLQDMAVESMVSVQAAGKVKIAAALAVSPLVAFAASVAHKVSGHRTGEEITSVLAP